MVDALRETGRVLSEVGILVDLRPLPSLARPIEVVTPYEKAQVGEVDFSAARADHEAADQAIQQVAREGLYVARGSMCFDLEFTCDTVAELSELAEDGGCPKIVAPSYAELEGLLSEWRRRALGRVRLRTTRRMTLATYDKIADRASPDKTARVAR